MLMMDIRDYDKLYELVMRLSALTLLQDAVTDEEYISYNVDEYDYALTYTQRALYEEQRKTVFEIKTLISSDGFIKAAE